LPSAVAGQFYGIKNHVLLLSNSSLFTSKNTKYSIMEQHYPFIKSSLILITVGIWVIVLQNAGIFPRLSPLAIHTEEAINVKGEVDVVNTVFIKGSVDENMESINGYSKFYKDHRTGEIYVIPTTDPYE